MQVDMPDFPMPAYDFITFTRYEDLPHKKVKLGVQFEEVEEADGLRIIKVVPESAAALAGYVPMALMDAMPAWVCYALGAAIMVVSPSTNTALPN